MGLITGSKQMAKVTLLIVVLGRLVATLGTLLLVVVLGLLGRRLLGSRRLVVALGTLLIVPVRNMGLITGSKQTAKVTLLIVALGLLGRRLLIVVVLLSRRTGAGIPFSLEPNNTLGQGIGAVLGCPGAFRSAAGFVASAAAIRSALAHRAPCVLGASGASAKIDGRTAGAAAAGAAGAGHLIPGLSCRTCQAAFAVAAPHTCLANAGNAVSEMIQPLADAVAHVAGQNGLIPGVVRQNACDNAAGPLCRGHTAQDQDDFSGEVQHIVIKQHQIAVYNYGNKDQHNPHGDNRPEHAEALHHKGGHPLLKLSAVVQGHNADKGRRHQIQEYHVKDSGHTVYDNDHQIPYQL